MSDLALPHKINSNNLFIHLFNEDIEKNKIQSNKIIYSSNLSSILEKTTTQTSDSNEILEDDTKYINLHKKRLNFSLIALLFLLPDSLIDYILIHYLSIHDLIKFSNILNEKIDEKNKYYIEKVDNILKLSEISLLEINPITPSVVNFYLLNNFQLKKIYLTKKLSKNEMNYIEKYEWNNDNIEKLIILISSCEEFHLDFLSFPDLNLLVSPLKKFFLSTSSNSKFELNNGNSKIINQSSPTSVSLSSSSSSSYSPCCSPNKLNSVYLNQNKFLNLKVLSITNYKKIDMELFLSPLLNYFLQKKISYYKKNIKNNNNFSPFSSPISSPTCSFYKNDDNLINLSSSLPSSSTLSSSLPTSSILSSSFSSSSSSSKKIYQNSNTYTFGLEYIKLSGCWQLSDDCLDLLTKSCGHSLRVVDISYCFNLHGPTKPLYPVSSSTVHFSSSIATSLNSGTNGSLDSESFSNNSFGNNIILPPNTSNFNLKLSPKLLRFKKKSNNNYSNLFESKDDEEEKDQSNVMSLLPDNSVNPSRLGPDVENGTSAPPPPPPSTPNLGLINPQRENRLLPAQTRLIRIDSDSDSDSDLDSDDETPSPIDEETKAKIIRFVSNTPHLSSFTAGFSDAINDDIVEILVLNHQPDYFEDDEAFEKEPEYEEKKSIITSSNEPGHISSSLLTNAILKIPINLPSFVAPLISLSLSGCHSVTSRTLLALAIRCPSIIYLDLSGTKVLDHHSEEIMRWGIRIEHLNPDEDIEIIKEKHHRLLISQRYNLLKRKYLSMNEPNLSNSSSNSTLDSSLLPYDFPILETLILEDCCKIKDKEGLSSQGLIDFILRHPLLKTVNIRRSILNEPYGYNKLLKESFPSINFTL